MTIYILYAACATVFYAFYCSAVMGLAAANNHIGDFHTYHRRTWWALGVTTVLFITYILNPAQPQ